MRELFIYLLLFCSVNFIFGEEYEINKYDMWLNPGTTQEITVTGSEVQLTLGTYDSLGLVGTRFELSLPGQPQTAINLCEARSAAGAGIKAGLVSGDPAATTEVIQLKTSHLENYYLEGEKVNLIAQFNNIPYSQLELEFSIKNADNEIVASGEKSLKIDSESFQETIYEASLNSGVYSVEYTFLEEAKELVNDQLKLEVLQDTIPSKEHQLSSLMNKLIFVPIGVRPKQEICDAAREAGYEVLNAPIANQRKPHLAEYYSEKGMGMIVRMGVPVYDPFNPSEIRQGVNNLKPLFDFYASHPGVKGFVLAWGFYGEGGFPVPAYGDYEFTGQALNAFNNYLSQYNITELPEIENLDQPQGMKYIKWLEFRQKTLRTFRKEYLEELQKETDKLVGTWSEIYPVIHHRLNMGAAPGADFMFYDLSFGDVTFNQKIAFGENHGGMEHHATFQDYKDRIVPQMAKAYGEGVTPIAFQYPMERFDQVKNHYAIKIKPYMEELLQSPVQFYEPEVALAYPSYAAAAFPQQREKLDKYMHNSREIQALLHMMGVNIDYLPWEEIKNSPLDNYNLVILPDAMYLTDSMYTHLKNSETKILVTGDFLRAYWDGESYIEDTPWGESKSVDDFEIKYISGQSGTIDIKSAFDLNVDLSDYEDMEYPEDRYANYLKLPSDGQILASVNDLPLLIRFNNDRWFHIPNRLFYSGRVSSNEDLEMFAFKLFKGILKDAGVNINITNTLKERARNYIYAPYGISNNILWNQTDQNLELDLNNGEKATVPANNWINLNN